MIDGEAINAEAMQKLSAGEFQRAQRLFRFNCKRFPDDRSYNNYGHFLFENGITRKDGSVHCARGLAKHYYEKAFAIRQTGIVAGNLAYAASREQNYREAYDYLKTALTLSDGKNDLAYYNFAVAAFQLQLYEQTVALLEPRIADFPMMLPLYYFALEQVDHKTLLQKMTTDSEWKRAFDDDEIALLQLYGLCPEYTAVESSFESLPGRWALDREQWATYIQVMSGLLSRPELDRLVLTYAGTCSPSTKRMILCFLRDPQIRRKYESRYVPVLVPQCGYFGCSKHGNGWSSPLTEPSNG